MPEILENRDGWYATYRDNWLAHFKATGEKDYEIYNRPTNKEPVAGKGVDLSRSRLMFITTSGGYLPPAQKPFDITADFGDYTIRTFPSSVQLDKLKIAHGNYDHAAVNADRQVLLPLRHLSEMVEEGKIGEMAPSVISFAGFLPDATRTVDELIPLIVEKAKAEQVQATLLVPA